MYRIYSVLVHLFAVFCVISVTSFYMCWLSVLALIGSILFYGCRKETIAMLECTDKKEWIVHQASAESVRVEILSSSVMMSWFLIVHFEVLQNKQKMHRVVFCDALSRDDFYALRRCVRCAFL